MSHTERNKKLNRAVTYHDDGSRTLYQGDEVVAGGVDADTAHRWFHGLVVAPLHSDAHETAPSLDDMLDAVAQQLSVEIAAYMSYAVDNPDALTAMYNATKRGVRRSAFGHVLTRAAW